MQSIDTMQSLSSYQWYFSQTQAAVMTGALSAAKRSYPTSEVRGSSQEELPHAQGQGRLPGGPTPHPRSQAARAQEGLEELLHIQGQEGPR